MLQRDKRYSFSNWDQGYKITPPPYSKPQPPRTKILHSQWTEQLISDGYEQQQIPSFGSSSKQVLKNLRDCQNLTKQRNIYQKMDLKISRGQTLGAGWEKPISNNIRSEQLKAISEQRVVNIDKINLKIKQILEKINDQEKSHFNNKKIDNYQKNQKRHQRVKTEECSPINYRQHTFFDDKPNKIREWRDNTSQKGDILPINRKVYDLNLYPQNQIWNNFQQRRKEPFQKDLKQNRRKLNSNSEIHYSDTESLSKNKFYLKKQRISSQSKLINKSNNLISETNYYKDLGSKQNDRYSRSVYLSKETKLTNGKNLDQEIQRIQKKMEQFQKLKKDLEISKVQPKNQSMNQSQATDEINIPKPFQMIKNRNSKRIVQNQNQVIPIWNQKSMRESVITHHLEQEADKIHLKKLIDNLTKQIQYDSKFRNSKKWFNSINSAYKWIELNHALEGKQIYMTQSQMKQIFNADQEEINPFYSVREGTQNYQILVDNFRQCEQFWLENIKHKFQKQSLQTDGFLEKNIDLEKKGIISIQDAVRFINFQANTFYRTRDIVLIFKRITNGYEIDYNNLLDELTHY